MELVDTTGVYLIWVRVPSRKNGTGGARCGIDGVQQAIAVGLILGWEHIART